MALSEAQLKEILKQNRGGTFDGCCGPVKFGSTLIWEIWVCRGQDYHARYVVETGQAPPLYFESFYVLGSHMDEMLSQASQQGAALKNRMHIERVSRYVASFVFVASAMAVLFVLLTRQDASVLILTTALGLISSGSALFFGGWIPIKGFSGPSEAAQTPLKSDAHSPAD